MGAVAEFRAAASVLMDRLRWANMAGITFGGRRDLYQILGYKRELTFWDFYDRYARDGIAKAVVEAYPNATWRGGVEVYEDEDPEKDTAFEQAWKEIEQRLGVWSVLQAVDILAGLSTYAVLLIGAAGEPDLTKELPRNGELLFLKPYSGGGGPGGRSRAQAQAFDASVSIQHFDLDPQSPRFGEPSFYSIRQASVNAPLLNREVHWSRVIHIAEGCLEDNVYGVPTLQNVFNLFDDLAKVTGGGSEAFWIRANQGLHLDVDKDMGLPGQASGGLTPADRDALRDKAEEIQHQLQRVLVTRGVTAKQLGSDVANFSLPADAILKQIAGSKGIPMRILTGSEMGTLASEQDAANFDSRVQDRRTGYAGPRIVRRLVDRLIEYGYLPTPKQYEVGWPVEENMDEKGKADFALQLATVNKTMDTVVFTEDEIRDMAFDKRPLKDAVASDGLSESQKAEIANKLAMANKAMGITVFTDDEIRKVTYGFAPLKDSEKVPIGAPERISVTTPPKLGEDGQPLPQEGQPPTPAKPVALPAKPLAEPLAATLKALEAAIEADDLAAIGRIIGLAAYATTQVQLPASFAEFARQIPDADLAADGRETDPHVTLKYGLHEDDPERLKAFLAGRGPITLTLGSTNFFATPDYDCLYVEVQSTDLENLNARIAEEFAVTDTHDEYIPHATIAYLKPGLGKKYAGDASFEGQQIVADYVTFSSADEARTVIYVG